MEMIENKKEVIITGDFNINLLKINEKYIFCEFLKSLIGHSYFPKITFPTRFSRTSGTLIDNFFCKLTRATFDITSGILTKALFTPVPVRVPVPFQSRSTRSCSVHTWKN